MADILIVEDDKTLRDVYMSLLRHAEHSVVTASNGMEALEACAGHTFDVILLDLLMPISNGVDFLTKAKLRILSPKTKVVIFSNESSGKLLDQAMKLGAIDHVVKSSITPHELLEYVAGVLS